MSCSLNLTLSRVYAAVMLGTRGNPPARRLGFPTSVSEEPLLTVPKQFFLQARFLWVFTPFGALTIIGLIALLMSGNLLLPFQRLVMLEGKAGSKAEVFQDEQLRKILLWRHLQVHVSRMGSHDAVNAVSPDDDFVFTSGQASAQRFLERLRAAKRSLRTAILAARYGSATFPHSCPCVANFDWLVRTTRLPRSWLPMVA
jgi:hypothetical protein